MAGYYYLISSLPMLMFNEKAPLNIDDFNEACVGQVSQSDLETLGRVTLIPDEGIRFSDGSAAEKWRQWETCLRNRIAVHRVPHGKDIHSYLQEEQACYCEIDTGTQEAFAIKNPLERERYFDHMRWRALEDFESGHHFDFDKLCVYKLKLLLIEKWNERRKEKGVENLDVVISHIDDSFEDNIE